MYLKVSQKQSINQPTSPSALKRSNPDNYPKKGSSTDFQCKRIICEGSIHRLQSLAQNGSSNERKVETHPFWILSVFPSFVC